MKVAQLTANRDASLTMTLTEKKITPLFYQYLADRSLTIETDSSGDCCGKINSMKPVIQYLKDHPEVDACNFGGFNANV